MIDPAPATLGPLLERLLANPTPDDLWQFQKALLVVGGPEAARARGVARAFQACLRTLESKSASRTASRWGAVLGTAAVASVSLPELRNRQERGLGELLERALPAVLEIGAALRSAEAWEIEAGLIYDEFAWFLYEGSVRVRGGELYIRGRRKTAFFDQVQRQLGAVDVALDVSNARGFICVLGSDFPWFGRPSAQGIEVTPPKRLVETVRSLPTILDEAQIERLVRLADVRLQR